MYTWYMCKKECYSEQTIDHCIPGVESEEICDVCHHQFEAKVNLLSPAKKAWVASQMIKDVVCYFCGETGIVNDGGCDCCDHPSCVRCSEMLEYGFQDGEFTGCPCNLNFPTTKEEHKKTGKWTTKCYTSAEMIARKDRWRL